jgi:hypothetical protein
MQLVSTPETLACTVCGDELATAGYLPARETDDGYEPMADSAVCDTCGFNEVGMLGCAPELGDVVDPEPNDVLLYVRRTEEGFEVVTAKR